MMKPRLIVPLFAVLSLFALPSAAPSPRVGPETGVSNDRIAYRRLTWGDFRVNDKAPGKSAQTQTFLSYQYTARSEGLPGAFNARVAEITFNCGFDRGKSWRRSTVSPNNRLLLEHEQGHLDITELKKRQLQLLLPEELPQAEGPNPKVALAELDRKMREFYRWHVEDMERIQRRYDRETEHGVQREAQAHWNLRLRMALEVAGEALAVPRRQETPPLPALPVPSSR
jgi:hypothetical protein